MIQFTSVTLLYSFALSLGDFQVIFFLKGQRYLQLIIDCSLHFLYINLFIIIPVAITSKLADDLPERFYCVKLTKNHTRLNASISSNILEVTNGESCVQEGPVEHH